MTTATTSFPPPPTIQVSVKHKLYPPPAKDQQTSKKAEEEKPILPTRSTCSVRSCSFLFRFPSCSCCGADFTSRAAGKAISTCEGGRGNLATHSRRGGGRESRNRTQFPPFLLLPEIVAARTDDNMGGGTVPLGLSGTSSPTYVCVQAGWADGDLSLSFGGKRREWGNYRGGVAAEAAADAVVAAAGARLWLL